MPNPLSSVRIPPELEEAIEQKATFMGWTKSQVVIDLLASGLALEERHDDGSTRQFLNLGHKEADKTNQDSVELNSLWSELEALKQQIAQLHARHLECEATRERQEQELSELRIWFLCISSEMRTPLSTIQSSAEFLVRYNLSEEKKQAHYRRFESAVNWMTQLLDQVVLIGKAEAGKLKFEPQPMDLVPWCRDLVERMQVVYNNQQQSTSHQYALTFTSSGECTDAQMDERLLAHILTNLLSNAIKYSLEGGTVQFDLVCTAREAIFRITDNGIGIPAEDLPRLFKSFYCASNVGKIQGTGLGLAIVKKAVDLYRGTIAVESEVHVGTTFTVRLPLKTSPLVSRAC